MPTARSPRSNFDALCRLTRTDLPLGGFSIQSYPDIGNPSAQRRVLEMPAADGTSGNDYVLEYFDGLGWTYRTVKKGPTPAQATIQQDVAYNARGGLASRTAPYYEGESPETTTYEYDGVNRLTRIVLPMAAT